MPIVPPAELQPVAPGTRLVHLGFHKSGTTAIQEAFIDARARLAKRDVIYPKTGGQRHHGKSALAVGEMHYGWKSGGIAYEEKFWSNLVAEVGRHREQTVVISSEHLAQVETHTIERIARDLGPDRVHAVATVRPLEKILPSSWQQYVKGGLTMPYVRWLKKVLADPPSRKVTPNFWIRHSHGDVMARWADVLGPENVTLIVVDETDRSMLFRSFEGLLGLPGDTLLAAKRRDDNRSMTAAEAELVRRISRMLRARGVDWSFFFTVIRSGVAQRMARERLPRPDELRLATPKWALERAAEIGAEAAAQIETLGITVVGDLSSLGRYVGEPGEDRPPRPELVPMGAAVEAVIGAIENYQRYAKKVTIDMKLPPGEQPTPAVIKQPPAPPDRPVKDVPSRVLIATVGQRVKGRVTEKLSGIRR